MADSNFIQRYFNRFKSGVKVGIYDSRLAAYIEVGRMMGVRVEETVEHAYQSHIMGSKTRETDSRVTGSTCTLSGTFMETLNPMTMQLLAQDYTDSQTISQNCAVVSLKWSHPLFWTEDLPVVPRAGICTATNLATVATATGSFSATGAATGFQASASNYFWVQPCYGTLPTVTYGTGNASDVYTTYSADIDRIFTAGTAAATGAKTAANTTDTFALTITLNTLGEDDPLPDFYIVYYGTTSTQTSAKVIMVVANTITRASAEAGGATQAVTIEGPPQGSNSAYVAPVQICVQTISSYSTGTPTLTKRTADTDYTYDQTNGFVRRINGGSISNGEQCVFTFWRIKPSYVRTNLGGGAAGYDFRQTIFVAIEPDPDNSNHATETVMGLGETLLLYKVDYGGLGVNLDFDGMAFEDGRAFTARVLLGDNQTYGYIDQESRMFVNWVQNYQ